MIDYSIVIDQQLACQMDSQGKLIGFDQKKGISMPLGFPPGPRDWTGWPFTKLALIRQVAPICKESVSFKEWSETKLNIHDLDLPVATSGRQQSVSSKIAPINPEQLERDFKIERLRSAFVCLYHHCEKVQGAQEAINTDNGKSFLSLDIITELIDSTEGLLWEALIKSCSDGGVTIDSRWLSGWFGLILLQFDMAIWPIKDRSFGDPAMSQYYKHFACYFLYLLHWLKQGDDSFQQEFNDVPNGFEEFIESKLYLVAEYAYRAYDFPPIFLLVNTLQEMLRNEIILYTSIDHYRDHTLHAVETWLMGLLLIRSGFPYSESSNNPSKTITNPKLERMWIVIATLHDVGYGIKLINEAVERVASSRLYYESLGNYLSGVRADLRSRGEQLLDELREVLNRENFQELTHGLVSAGVAKEFVKEYVSSKKDNFSDEGYAILDSIVQHDNPNAEIDPKHYPLSYLLFLCDHVQEWNRPRITSSFPNRLMAKMHGSQTQPFKIKTLLRTIWLNLTPNHKATYKAFSVENNRTLIIKLFYNDANKEDFEPVLIWLSNTLDFQRLNRMRNLWDLKLTFHNPISYYLKRLLISVAELDLFEQFVRDNQLFQKHSYLPTARHWVSLLRKNDDNSFIKYSFRKVPNKSIGVEEFTINLCRNMSSCDSQVCLNMEKEQFNTLREKFVKWKKEVIKDRQLAGHNSQL